MARSRAFIVPQSHSNQKRRGCCPMRYSESRIWPEIVPLLTHSVASLAHSSSLLPVEFMSRLLFCDLNETSKVTLDSHSVLDMLQEQGLSVCPYLQHS